MSSHSRGPYSGGGQITLQFPPVTPMVKLFLIAVAVMFGAQLLFGLLLGDALEPLLSTLRLSRPGILERFQLWQFLSYAFLHGSLWHLLSNMLGLWMFGGDVERVLGSKRFAGYTLLCIAGGGVAYVACSAIVGSDSPVVGISAAVLGIVVAFASFFPERELLLFPLPFPIKARTLAFAFAFFDLYGAITTNIQIPGIVSTRSSAVTAFTAHLGGMLVGWLYLRLFIRGGGAGWGGLFRQRRPFRVIDGKRDDPFSIN